MDKQHQFRRPEGVKVALRRMKFDFEDGFDRYWHSGSPFRSLFWSQLSTAFAPGEKFFIDSAKAMTDKIEDEQLLEEMREFYKQEGHHTFQHMKFDKVNAEQNGLPMRACRDRYGWILDRVRKRLDPLDQLAVTVSLEHFTAGLADVFLRHRHISEGADPKVVALWAWHAIEETEHKATCYDVFQAAGGTFWTRATTLPVSWAIIIGISLYNTLWLLKREGKLWTRDTLRGFGYLFGRKGVFTMLIPEFLAFYGRRFHPWKQDNADEIRRWQASNARYIQSGPGAAAA